MTSIKIEISFQYPQSTNNHVRKHPSRGVQQIYRCCLATLLKSNFDMGGLLYICCIFSDHPFLWTLLDGCFCMLWNTYLPFKNVSLLVINADENIEKEETLSLFPSWFCLRVNKKQCSFIFNIFLADWNVSKKATAIFQPNYNKENHYKNWITTFLFTMKGPCRLDIDLLLDIESYSKYISWFPNMPVVM